MAVAAGTIARQCLEAGLLDEVAIDLVPVVFGGGRPFFGELSPGDLPLGDPTTCIQSDRVIHLVYPVRGAVRTLQFGLKVADRETAVAFYVALGFEVVGEVPDSPIGHLTMLKLPDDEFVSLELVHDPAGDDTAAPGSVTSPSRWNRSRPPWRASPRPASAPMRSRHRLRACTRRTSPIPTAARSSSSSGHRGTRSA